MIQSWRYSKNYSPRYSDELNGENTSTNRFVLAFCNGHAPEFAIEEKRLEKAVIAFESLCDDKEDYGDFDIRQTMNGDGTGDDDGTDGEAEAAFDERTCRELLRSKGEVNCDSYFVWMELFGVQCNHFVTTIASNTRRRKGKYEH